MSEELLLLAIDFRVDNRLVPWDELIGSDTLLTELGYALTRSGPWPLRTAAEIRQELLRLQERWKKTCSKSASYPEWATRPPLFWVYKSEDEDDIFMPSVVGSSVFVSKEKILHRRRVRVVHRRRARVVHPRRARVVHHRRDIAMLSNFIVVVF
jgi:hypothetical protein